MNDGTGITFYPTGIILAVGFAVMIVTGFLCWLAWCRSGFARGTGLLELLRFILVGLVVATLCQPEWLNPKQSDQKPTLAILLDESNSMQTRDILDNNNLTSGPQSRVEAIAPLKNESIWKPKEKVSREDLNVVFEPFSSGLSPAQEGTDLNAGLLKVIENQSNLRGVVLLSDGDWNVGVSPVEAATQYRMKGIPVFAVGVGSRVPLADIELISMDAPTFAVAKKPLRIPFAVRSTLGQDRDITVTLSVEGKPEASKIVRVPAMGQVQQSLSWMPLTTGDFRLSMSFPQGSRDLISDNNEVSAPLSVRQEQLNVLVIESYPRWEYRYLRNALERDPGVEVTCLLFHPELPKSGGGRAYIKQFPSSAELNRFDVVFLGDVGINEKQLTLANVQDLKQLVSSQASGLVFIPGRYGFQGTLTQTPLADLNPVLPSPSTPTGVGSIAPGHFLLTQSGRQSLLTKLAKSDDGNADIWNKLPGFHWHAGAVKAKVGSEVLGVLDQEVTSAGRAPLIVTKTYGTGKVLFMGTDSAWRWREGVEDRYHYRFWGQVARWMAYQRQKAQGKSMRLFSSPDRPRVGDEVALNANVLDALGGFLEKGDVTVQVISPTGKKESIRLEPGEKDARGLFMGSFKPEEPGNFKLIATSADTGVSVQTDLSVQGYNRERLGQLARFDVLEEITTITRGKMVAVSEVQSLLDYLAALPEPEMEMHRIRIWAHPAWCGFLIFLMALFWTGRKINGSV